MLCKIKRVNLARSYFSLTPIETEHMRSYLQACSIKILLKHHFYIVNPRFSGVYLSFLISKLEHILWVLVRTGLKKRLASTHNLCFEEN